MYVCEKITQLRNKAKKLYGCKVENNYNKITLNQHYTLSHILEKKSFSHISDFLWKTIYEEEGFYYVDAVRLFSKLEYCKGTIIKKLDLLIDFSELDKKSQQYKDIKRFDWFSQGYLGKGIDENIITDVRYSAVPNEVDGLWGIRINLNKPASDHIDWVVNRRNYLEKWKRFFDLLLGKNCQNLIN